MKVLGIISTATLFLLLGTAVSAVAQDDHHDDGTKPAQREQQAKPAKQERQAKPAKQEEQAKPARQEQAKANDQQQTKSAKQEPQSKPAQHEQQAKPVKQQRQAKPEQRQQQAKANKPETRTKPVKQTEERGNAGGQGHVQRTAAAERTQRSQPALRLSARGDSRIPDARFRSNFGRQHEFRIGSPRLVDGYSRFQYGGYWFGFVQPWPAGWYYTDDVYVDYINGGYYLCNPEYPGTQIAISVVL
ncbi:MAG: hypothetical protein WA581_08525 [Candidatus Acidiferrales bacterium]